MKPINETHPSLKYAGIITYDKDMEYIDANEVQKHTTDNAVLREIIIKYRNKIYDAEGSDYCYNDLLKELGFEEEE